MRLLILSLFFISFSLQGKTLELSVNAEFALVMNAKTGQLLFEKNAYEQAYPASTTKIATALWALHKYENCLDQILCAEREAIASITPQAKKQSNYRSPPHWLETDGTHAGIKRGEELKLYDLLHLMLIASANDAANVIALGLGGTIPKFMEEMNDFLKKIGCLHTHYNNPHGLHHPHHVTTAYDLAIMAKEALKYPLFKQIVSSARYICPETNLELERPILQGNHLLRKGPYHYPKAIGIKTGFTSTSGKNLVAAARDKERVFIVVALGYKGPRAELYQDVIKMFDTAFAENKLRRTLLIKGEQKMTARIKGARTLIETFLTENLTYDYYPSEEVPIKLLIQWDIPLLPISKGSRVGKLQLVTVEGNLLKELPFFAAQSVEMRGIYKMGIFLKEKIIKPQVVIIVGLILLIFIMGALLRTKKRARSNK